MTGSRWRALDEFHFGRIDPILPGRHGEDQRCALLTAFAILLAVIAAAVGASYFALRPTEFKVAVPASNPLDQRVIGQAADMLRAQRAPVRLELVITENTKTALEALEAGKVNLAVVRSDSALQGQAHTVMIMRREAAVLVAPKAGKLQKIHDLPNATIGIARDGPVDNSLLFPVLDYYGIAHDKVKFTVVPTDEVGERDPAEEDRWRHRRRRASPPSR